MSSPIQKEICYEKKPDTPKPPDGSDNNYIEGVCSPTNRNTCISGETHSHPGDNSYYYRWTCRSIPHQTGPNGERFEDRCQLDKPNHVSCGKFRYSCAAGRLLRMYGSTDTHDQWKCISKDQLNSRLCYAPRDCPLVEGQCDNSVKDGCTSGTASGSTYLNGVDTWKCKGSCGGGDSIHCSKLRSDNPTTANITEGRCNNAIRNNCSAGDFNSHPGDSATHYRWSCRNKPYEVGDNGKKEDLCEKEMPCTPEAGVCDNSITYGCTSGTPNRGAHGNTGTQYRWRCDGECGGNNSVRCSKSKNTSTSTPTVIVGRCGTSANTCAAGDHHSHPPDTSAEYLWTCRNIPHQAGPNGEAREVRCSAQKATPTPTPDGTSPSPTPTPTPTPTSSPMPSPTPTPTPTPSNFVEGRCGTSANTCAAGDHHSHPPDTSAEYLWTCRSNPHRRGPNGEAREVRCSAQKAESR